MNFKIKRLSVLFSLFILIACSGYGGKVVYDGTEIYYLEEISEDLANNTGAFLEEMKFTDGTTKSIQLSKDSVYNFKMVTQDQFHTDTSMDVNFQALGFLLSKDVFNGEAINFVICDNTFKTKRILAIEGAGE